MPGALTGVRTLTAAASQQSHANVDGWIAVAGDHRQWLLGLYDRAALVMASQQGADSLHDLLAGLRLVDVVMPATVVEDLDYPTDLLRLGFSPAEERMNDESSR